MYDHNNNPLSGKTANIYLANNATVYQTNTTDADGYTEFFVDVQNYDLRVDPTGWNRFYEDILNPYTKRLYGLLVNVTNQNTQAVNNAQVWVYEAGTTTSYNSNTNSSGMITFGLENQSYDISTFKQGVFSRLLRQDVPSTANVELDLTVTDYLEDINRTVHAINDSITNTIIPYLQEINSTTHTTYSYLEDTIYPKVNDANSTISDVLAKWGDYNATVLYDKINDANSTISDVYTDTQALIGKWGSRTADELFNEVNDTEERIQEVLDKWGTYNASELYDRINLTYNNTQQTLTYIGNPADDENQNTLFGEHTYTQNKLSSISGNLTEVKNIVTQINITTEAINSTVSTILLEVDDLEELHQCSISPNSTICTLLNNIKTDTTNIYTLATAINTTISSMNLFSISALIAGSPRYANEEALIEATFTTQNGSYVTPDTINITIYDPNDNIWQSATKAQFTEGSSHIWTYSKSISTTPTTGMYTTHMLSSYQGVSASKSAQFRIATGGPYKVYLECPTSSYLGQDLICNVILKDEGEVPTESTSTVWLDFDNNGVWDVGETQMSFSKQTVPLQNVTQSISLNIPSSYPTGLQMIRLDTSYASSSQPNSGASDSVTFSTAPAGDEGGPSGGGGAGGVPTIEIEEKEGKISVIDFPEKIEIIKTESLEKTIGIKNIGEGNLNNVRLVISGLPLDSYTIFPEKYDIIPPGATQTFLITFKADIEEKEYEIKFIVTSDEGSEEVSSILSIKGVGEAIPEKEGEKIPIAITVPSYWPIILIILIVLAGLVYFTVKKKEEIKELFRKKHKSKEKITTYNLLNVKNIIIAVLAVIVLASILFNISIKEIPSKIINVFSAVKLPSISLNLWFVFGALLILFLAGIFVVLILILKEIRKLTAGKRLKPLHKFSKKMLLIIGIIILIVLFLLMLISNPSITGNVVGVADEGDGFWLVGLILIIGIVGLLIFGSKKKNKEIFQEIRNVKEKPIEKKTESLHQDMQNLQSAGFKVKPTVRETREKQRFSVSQKSPISVRLEKMQGLDKPTHNEVRTNVYKMLEENGVDIGAPALFQKAQSQKTEQIKPEIQAKRITAPINKQEMLDQLKGVYK